MDQCDYWIDYMFASPSGDRHALRLSAWKPGSMDCAQWGPTQYLSGGDDRYQAAASDGTPLTSVSDADGTVYNFGDPGLPYSVVDRNGNQATFSNPNSNWGFTMTDTAGRAAVVVSGFQGPGGDTITVSGLSNSYQISWGSETSAYTPSWKLVYDATGACASFTADAITQPAITSITLPNKQAYQFHYDSTYGLLDEIDYPTGAKVVYTWGLNQYSESVTLYDRYGNADACGYEYSTPAITERQVFDSSGNLVLTQNFSYVTTWPQPASKVTTVSQTGAGGVNSQRVYTYSFVSGSVAPNDQASYYNIPQIPVEKQVVYKDGNGNTMRTVTKGWYDQFELACDLDTHDGSGLSGVFYTYGPGAQVTDKEEYDYGAISSTSDCPPNPSSPIALPSGSARGTQTTYTSITESSGFKIEDRPTSIVISGASSAETDYAYDPNGNAQTKTRKCLNGCPGGAGDATTHYTYDGHGQLIQMTDPNGNPTTYAYDSSYDTYLTQITYPPTGSVAHVVKFGYDLSSGDLTSSTDQNNPPNTTGYQYADSLNRLTEIDYPDGGKTTYSYNDSTNSVTADKLLLSGVWTNQSTSTTDGLGHVVKIIGENLAETDMTYDGEGQLYKQTNPGDPSHFTIYNHDALGRLISTVYQDGDTASVGYSINGNSACATTTDPAGKTNETCSDALGRMTSDLDGLRNTTTYTYDALDNLTSVTQGSQSRTFSYNSLSELYSETNPESGTTTYTYDANGNALSRTDARGIITSYNCNGADPIDALNRVTCKSYSDGTPTVNFYYDQTSVALNSNWTSPTLTNPIGRLTYATTTASGSVQTALIYGYDPMGRIAALWQCTPYNCGGNPFAMTYNYDLAGDVKSYTHPSGFTVSMGIDAAQQATSLTWGSNTAVSQITYAASGAISTICGGQGCAQSQETRQYNDRLQPALMELGNSNNASADYCLVYNYYSGTPPSGCSLPTGSGSNNGNVQSSWYQDSVNTNFSHTTANTYDAVNRLETAVATGNSTYNLTYSYDQYGNGACVMNGSTQGLCPQFSFNPANNQISNSGFTYDADGNITNDGHYAYQYDAEGRLVYVTNVPPGSWSQTSVYNALGEHVEDDFPDGQYTRRLIYPLDLEGHWTEIFDDWPSQNWAGADVFDARVAGERLQMGGSSSYLLHGDAVGTTTMVTDQAGTVDMDNLFYPWGQVWQQTGPNIWASFADLGFTNVGDVYPAAHRDYQATLGRWLTPDPAGQMAANPANPQSWNMYAYAGNNPTTLNDPSGLYSWGESCGPHEAACQKHRQEFRNGLRDLRNARNSFNPKSKAYKRLSRVLAAYGTEGHGGPAIAFGNVAKGFGGNFNPATNTVTLDLARYGSSSLDQLNFGTLVAHEGEHYADRALTMAQSQREYRAYEATSWTAQGEGLGSWTGIPPDRGVLWNSTTSAPGANFNKGFLQIWQQIYEPLYPGPVVMPYDPFPNE